MGDIGPTWGTRCNAFTPGPTPPCFSPASDGVAESRPNRFRREGVIGRRRSLRRYFLRLGPYGSRRHDQQTSCYYCCRLSHVVHRMILSCFRKKPWKRYISPPLEQLSRQSISQPFATEGYLRCFRSSDLFTSLFVSCTVDVQPGCYSDDRLFLLSQFLLARYGQRRSHCSR